MTTRSLDLIGSPDRMRKIALLPFSLAAMLALVLPATPARALDLKTFVASFGNSGAACTRADPCLDFNRAVSLTADGGEVNCLDSGPIVGGTITKSVTIDCGGTSATALPNTSGTVFAVNGAGIVVRFRNLTLNGTGSKIGINFQNGAALFIEKCVIMNFNSSAASGIWFQPSTAGSQLIVTDTIISNNGADSNSVGIRVEPVGSAGVVLNRVKFGFNVTGLNLEGIFGPIGAVMRDVVVSSSRDDGILLLGDQPITFIIERSSIDNNITYGIRTFNANSTVRIGDSTLAGNITAIRQANGGVVESFKDNLIAGNGSDSTPLPAFPGPGGPLQ